MNISASSHNSRHPPVRLSWLVWGLGASLYFMGFYQRVAPAVMTDQLMSDFSIGAAALGNFSAFYFYSYVAMQVPTGILVDHWGARRLLAAGAIVAAAGTFLFAMAEHVLLANLGRLLIGGSVAVAWVGLMKVAMHWFPHRKFAAVTGVALLCGVAGAVSAGVPLRFLVELVGWREVMWAMGLFCLGIGVAVWIIVRDDPRDKGYASFAVLSPKQSKIGPTATLQSVSRDLAGVFGYRNTLPLSIAQAGMVGAVLTFCGLWGVPYLEARFGLSARSSAAVTSAVMMAWALSGPVFGIVSDRIGRRKGLYVGASTVALVAWTVALHLESLSLPAFVGIALLAGSACGVVIVGFAFAKESAPPRLAGTISGVCNMGTMSGPMFLQPAVGWLLDRHWGGTLTNGVRVYEVQAYQHGFLLISAWLILTVLLACGTKETYCRPPREEPVGEERER